MKPLPDIAEFGCAHSEIAKPEEQTFREGMRIDSNRGETTGEQPKNWLIGDENGLAA